MFKLNSILKIVLVMFLSLVIPSFISLFKISFDEYVAAQETTGSVKGASVVKVQTVNNKSKNGNSEGQTVFVDFALPKMGPIQNLSQRPFKFPKAKQIPVSAPVNTTPPLSYPPLQNGYSFDEDNGRGLQDFDFSFGGVSGDSISFYNSNNYDMNNVRIEVKWINGTDKFTSVYSTYKIQSGKFFIEKISNSAEASIPYNPQKVIAEIRVSFTDNLGSSFNIKL